MTPSLQTAAFLLNGAVLGAMFALVAFAVRPFTRELLFGLLVVAALAYVVFALDAPDPAPWLLVEVAGGAVYVALGYRGLRGSLWWLVAGWALHPVWDAALHVAGPGAPFAPAWWAVPCVSFDLVVAGLVALPLALRTHPALTPPLRSGAV
jgi:hypothetical protein